MKLAILFLLLMIGSTSAITPFIVYNAVSNTISIIIPPQSNKALGYNQQVNFALNSLILSNVILTTVSNSIQSNSSTQTSSFFVSGPGNNQPLAQNVVCVNGQPLEIINNVSIQCPPKLSGNLTLSPKLANQSKIVTLAPNVSFTLNVLSSPACSFHYNALSSWSGPSQVLNTIFPCNINLTINQNNPLGINITNAIAPFNYTNNIYGIHIKVKQHDFAINGIIPSFNGRFENDTANIILYTAPINSFIVNYTYWNQVSNGTWKANCVSNITIGSQTYCDLVKGQTNYSAATICQKQALIDHNVFEGLGQCIVSLANASSQKNKYNFSQLNIQINQTNYWKQKYDDRVASDNQGLSALNVGNSQTIYILIFLALVAGFWFWNNKKEKADITKYDMDRPKTERIPRQEREPRV